MINTVFPGARRSDDPLSRARARACDTSKFRIFPTYVDQDDSVENIVMSKKCCHFVAQCVAITKKSRGAELGIVDEGTQGSVSARTLDSLGGLDRIRAEAGHCDERKRLASAPLTCARKPNRKRSTSVRLCTATPSWHLFGTLALV